MGSKADVSRITDPQLSEPDRAEIGRSMGDNKGDNIEDDAAACCARTGTARPPEFPGHQGQVGYRGSQIQLESRLDPGEIAGLANAQLDQSGQPVFHHHSAHSIFVIVSALLQRSGLLQQGFLGMDQHPPPPAPLGCDALGSQWTCPTFGPVELEGLQAVDPPCATRPLSRWHDGVGNLSRRTGATARGQVDDKVILGKVLPVGPSRHSGHQPASASAKACLVSPSP